jgi:NAD(P)-dependent dehydrogenase (short-subunit alcohol dehydrogenase family)
MLLFYELLAVLAALRVIGRCYPLSDVTFTRFKPFSSVSKTPLGRLATPEEIAKATAFLIAARLPQGINLAPVGSQNHVRG